MQLAVDSLVDGALLEGFSARLIAKLIPRCHDEATGGLLKELAADEGRHSKHGWDVLEWCLSEGGESVAQALRGAIEGLPHAVKSTLPEGARSGAWECYGIAGEQLEAETYVSSREHVAKRIETLVQSARSARTVKAA